MEVFELKSGKVILVSGLIDLQDEIIETLGEDVYNYIKGLCTFKVMDEEEADQVKTLKDEIKILEDELGAYDQDIYNLRNGLVDTKGSIDKLITNLFTAKRLDRSSLIKSLEDMSKEIANNESY